MTRAGNLLIVCVVVALTGSCSSTLPHPPGHDKQPESAQVKSASDPRSHPPAIRFHEGNDGEQDVVCYVPVNDPGTIYIRMKDGNYGCKNDEARSMVLDNVKPGTIITVYNDPSFNPNKDNATITVLGRMESFTISSFERNHVPPTSPPTPCPTEYPPIICQAWDLWERLTRAYSQTYRRDDGDLDGKVSSAIITVPAEPPP